MAVQTYVNSREQLKDYCLRKLGHPVVEVNVSPDQIDDRINDALKYFRERHWDGTEHIYLPIQVSAQNITNKYLSLDESIIGVTRILPISSETNANNLFNLRYQLHLNDFFNITNIQLGPYYQTMQYIQMMEEIFMGQKPVRFSKHEDRLYIDFDWSADISPGQYIIIDGYRVIDPEVYTDVYDDVWLQRYATALIKRQWGNNMKKFQGMNLPGGLVMNGQQIYDEAELEIKELESQAANEVMLYDMIG